VSVQVGLLAAHAGTGGSADNSDANRRLGTLSQLEGAMRARRYTEERSFVREGAPLFKGTRVSLAHWATRPPRS